MKGVKVTLVTKPRENLLRKKVDFTFGGRALGYHRDLVFSYDGYGMEVGKKYTVSFYVDADNVQIMPADEITQHSGWGEEYAAYFEQGSSEGNWKADFRIPNIPWGTYTHKRLSQTVKFIGTGKAPYYFYYRWDNWASGKIRIYDVKIEEGDYATDYEE